MNSVILPWLVDMIQLCVRFEFERNFFKRAIFVGGNLRYTALSAVLPLESSQANVPQISKCFAFSYVKVKERFHML